VETRGGGLEDPKEAQPIEILVSVTGWCKMIPTFFFLQDSEPSAVNYLKAS